jgi:hypothetical protein
VAGVETDRPDPFALVEEVSVRAIMAHDPTTTRLVLRCVTNRVIGYLTGREFVARGVLAWLAELLYVIGRQLLPLEERTAEFIVVLFQVVLAWVLEPRQHRPGSSARIEFLKSFRELRHAAIREGKMSVVHAGLFALSLTFPIALKAAPLEDQIWRLHPREPFTPQDNRDADFEWSQLEEDWVRELSRDIELLSAAGFEDAFNTGQMVYRLMVDDILQAKNLGSRQKRSLIERIIWSVGVQVREALNRGRGEGYISQILDQYQFESLDREDLGDLVLSALKEWGFIMTTAVKVGKLSRMVVNDFAAAGRGFAHKGQDERSILIASTLTAVAETLRRKAVGETYAEYDWVIDAIRSLAAFDQRETSTLKDVVRAELCRLERAPQ